MKVKVNFKKPTVMLTANKYSSMLEEMASLRRGLDQYKSWCENLNISLQDAREQADALRAVVARKDAEVVERNALIQELDNQIGASETARKDAEDALVIAKKNATLREMGWDLLHKQIEELQRENRGLRMKLDRAERYADDLEDAKQTIANLQEFRKELAEEVDEANRVIAEMATELTELKADRNIALAEAERLRGQVAQKEKINDTSFKATNELAEMLIASNKERDEARARAEEYHIELMECDCRVDELEKRNEWLENELEQWKQSAENYQCAAIAIQEDLENLRVAHGELTDSYQNLLAENTALVGDQIELREVQKENASLKLERDRWKESATENLEIAKDYHHEALKYEADAKRFKEAYDALYEQFADNHASAQYWEEQAQKFETEVDTLRRQLKANEESYTALRAMYEELRNAATGLVSHIRTNTFAN